MGAVIDAIPRITADANGNFTRIAFELIKHLRLRGARPLRRRRQRRGGQRGRGAIQHGAFRYRGKPYGRITAKKERQQSNVAVFQCVREVICRPCPFSVRPLALVVRLSAPALSVFWWGDALWGTVSVRHAQTAPCR